MKKLTQTQFDVLDAVLEGKGPYERRRKDPTHVFGAWKRVRSMGGAARKMVEALVEDGLLSDGDSRSTRTTEINNAIPPELRDYPNKLTAKGLEALEAWFLARRPNPLDGRLGKVRELLPVRRQFEADRAALIERLEAEDRDRYSRQREARKLAKAEVLRDLFTQAGLNFPTDDEMLAFAKKVEAAQFSDRDVEFLSDDDLSAELDELEKTAVVIGTIGASQRDKRINVIRAEFTNRAKAA